MKGGPADRARAFVLDTLRAFNRQGVDADRVVTRKLQGKYLPLPAEAAVDTSGSGSGGHVSTYVLAHRQKGSASRACGDSGGSDFHSKVHSSAVKIRTLATRQRCLLAKRQRRRRLKPCARGSAGNLSYATSPRQRHLFKHLYALKVPVGIRIRREQ